MADRDELVERVQAGDRVALARLISRVERREGDFSGRMAQLHSLARGVHCIGITGPPGAGKSTLTDHLIAAFRARGLSVGVLAVDPSSPFSGGAVLGDRIRMQRHALDDGVFIRSLATRGRLGGISRATRDIRILMDAAGMDVVLVETVGVGQTELEVMQVVDTTVVVMVPEAGDAVQTLKAGLLEIADIFVVNKADREGADRMMADLRTLVMMRGPRAGWESPVLDTVANTGRGVDALMEQLDAHEKHAAAQPELSNARRRAALEDVLLERSMQRVRESLREDETVKKVLDRVTAGDLDPYTAATQIEEHLGFPDLAG